MKKMKRGQISTEYAIIVSFMIFVIISAMGIAFFYANGIRETIKFRQIESFSNKIITLSESIYFAGEPSRTTMTAYLPDGIEKVEVIGKEIVFDVATTGGTSRIAFASNVNLEGVISPASGVKKFYLTAQVDKVKISESGFS